ncbi:MAG: hypothetical protein BGP06_14025 [Rhizobiales bacterium 65-9]|nr:EF-hand domain-containing protein [Hyphomicrobiales bacterium]OJY36798.1 MAG: hypothetical protein BGP06_14025 [Rhizobiales bacterium 65-9]
MLRQFALAAAAAFAVISAAPVMAGPAPKQAGAAKPQARQPARAAAPDPAAARAARVDRMFRVADRNRDNALSRSEYTRWYRVAARRRGPLTWRKHAAQMFRQLDVGQKGRLTKAEFANDPAFRRVRPGWTRAVIGALSADQPPAAAPDAGASAASQPER